MLVPLSLCVSQMDHLVQFLHFTDKESEVKLLLRFFLLLFPLVSWRSYVGSPRDHLLKSKLAWMTWFYDFRRIQISSIERVLCF